MTLKCTQKELIALMEVCVAYGQHTIERGMLETMAERENVDKQYHSDIAEAVNKIFGEQATYNRVKKLVKAVISTTSM